MEISFVKKNNKSKVNRINIDFVSVDECLTKEQADKFKDYILKYGKGTTK